MAELGNHANIVSIIGVITCGDPLVLVVAYCEHGSLLSMLRKRAAASDALGVMAKIRIGRDTARGMAYLSAKSFVHRDLAARNVLVSSGLIAKIGDFGLSRNVSSDDARDGYYKSVKGQFAVRWTSPEAMATMKYTPASDVWSFGVTLYETYTDGARPYEEMDIATVINKVQSGFRMLQPDGCPNAVYAAMMLCWDENPLSRPSFTDLEVMLDDAERDHLHHPAANNNNFVIGKEPGVVESNYMSASDGVNCESTYSDSILRRVLSSSVETDALTSPLDSLASTRLVGFREAVAIASQHVPYQNSPRLIEAMDASLKFGENLVRRGKAVGLTVDQAAAIHFYSVEAPVFCPFYSAVNGALGGWGSHGGRAAIKHFLPYIKLLTSGLALLPKEKDLVVYRGVRSVPLETMLGGRGIGDILTWWALVSTTSCDDVLRDSHFLGVGAELGERTVFKITSSGGARIKNFSNFGAEFEYYLQPVGTETQNEEEVLFPPGTSFVIDGIVRYPDGITEVTMHEAVGIIAPAASEGSKAMSWAGNSSEDFLRNTSEDLDYVSQLHAVTRPFSVEKTTLEVGSGPGRKVSNYFFVSITY